MDLVPSPEQQEIIDSVGAFLAAELPIARVRASIDGGAVVDRALWSRIAEMGWFGLGLPERLGGVGYGVAEEALLFREIGRRLTPGPVLATVLAARVAAVAGDTDLAASIVSGETIAGWAEPRRDHHVETAIGRAVSGSFVLIDAAGADLVLAVDDGGAALVPADRLAGADELASLDDTARLARIEIDAVASAAYVTTADDPILWRGLVLTAATSVGIAEATRDMAVEYARNRIQFGKPIGVNQAIRHPCAEAAIRAEAALSQTLFAALTLDKGHDDAPFQVAAARVIADDAARRNAHANVQIHGGIGFTWEHDAHLFVKRSHVLAQQLGGRRRQMARLLAQPAAQR